MDLREHLPDDPAASSPGAHARAVEIAIPARTIRTCRACDYSAAEYSASVLFGADEHAEVALVVPQPRVVTGTEGMAARQGSRVRAGFNAGVSTGWGRAGTVVA